METNHPGISYTHLIEDTPLSVHVVKANPRLCRILPARALNSGLGRECLISISERYNALAAISGGYFMVGGSFDGKSQGALKIKERWFASPTFDCSTVAWMHDSPRVAMSRIGMVWSLVIDGVHMPIDGLNMPLKPGKAVLYTSAHHFSTLSPYNTPVEVLIESGHVVAVHRCRGDSDIPREGYVYSVTSDNEKRSHPFAIGMPAQVTHRIGLLNERFEDAIVTPDEVHFWQHCDYLMSGAPLLIQDGVRTKEYEHDRLRESVMFATHPRSAVGITKEGEWIFVIVEGRQPRVSLGMNVHELAELMEDLGCIHALNLDGGASCLMIVEGQLANTPIFNGLESSPQEIGQRRISDAFVIVERGDF